MGRGRTVSRSSSQTPGRVRALNFEEGQPRNRGVTSKAVKGDRSDSVILKVCYLLCRPSDGEELLWIPTQDWHTAFPIWGLGGRG